MRDTLTPPPPRSTAARPLRALGLVLLGVAWIALPPLYLGLVLPWLLAQPDPVLASAAWPVTFSLFPLAEGLLIWGFASYVRRIQ